MHNGSAGSALLRKIGVLTIDISRQSRRENKNGQRKSAFLAGISRLINEQLCAECLGFRDLNFNREAPVSNLNRMFPRKYREKCENWCKGVDL